ncbi:hypothetical protein ACLB2K_038428 [Fragaria x ananassa]
MCALCGEHPETTEHCLLLCPWTSVVWFGSSLRYIQEKAFITSLDAWLLAVYSNSVMKRVSPNPITTIENIHRSFKEWSEAQSDYNTPPDEPQRSTASKLWHPPPPNVVKVNIDAAWKTSNHHCGIGLVVLWNWVPREANRVADAATKLAMVRLCSLDWANTPPTSLLHILKSDEPPD